MFFDTSLRIANKLVGDISDKSLSKESTGNTGLHFSRHEAFQASNGVATGRQFSEYLLSLHWSLKQIAQLNRTQFNLGESDIYGRDIIYKYGISSAIVQDIIFRVWTNANPIWYEYADNGKIIINAWQTRTGKRTWHSRPDNGMGHEKQTIAKRYKRNRRSMGF